MDRRAMLALAQKYAWVLDSQGAVVRRADLDRLIECAHDRTLLLNHARWHIEMVNRVIDCVGGGATAIRLLGSAQGILIATGLISVGQTARDNREWLDSASNRAFDVAFEQLSSATSVNCPGTTK